MIHPRLMGLVKRRANKKESKGEEFLIPNMQELSCDLFLQQQQSMEY
jgi:hypothetical protein